MAGKPCVWIAIPLRHFEYDGPLTREIFKKLPKNLREPIEELCGHQDLPWDIYLTITGGGGVIAARGRFASDFMANTKNPEDRLFGVDSDLLWKAQDMVDILLRDLPIVGGLYTARADNGHWILNRFENATPTRGGLLPVMELGTGFKCFKRSALQKVLDDNPWLDCESDQDHTKRHLGFFSCGPVWDKKLWPGKGRWLTEDYWLDWLCRESGFTTWADTKVKLRHRDDFTGKIFPAVFPPDPGQLPAEAKEL